MQKSTSELIDVVQLDPRKFQHPRTTADGQQRARVGVDKLTTLWFNTGSLCNITCDNCFMESSPSNDALSYLNTAEVTAYLDELMHHQWPVTEIGFTGGEPFMNPDIMKMLEAVLRRGLNALVLTNAMKPMHHHREMLLDLHKQFADKLHLRVSMDHYTQAKHELVRGPKTWQPMLRGLRWLSKHGFAVAVAGRTLWHESELQSRHGFGAFFASENIHIDADHPAALVLFPEMDERVDVPEITVDCWDILGQSPQSLMCASSRMVVKRSGAMRPNVVPCTLLPYAPQFDLGPELAAAVAAEVPLNHPHCAKFCVLGGASCSPDS